MKRSKRKIFIPTYHIPMDTFRKWPSTIIFFLTLPTFHNTYTVILPTLPHNYKIEIIYHKTHLPILRPQYPTHTTMTSRPHLKTSHLHKTSIQHSNIPWTTALKTNRKRQKLIILKRMPNYPLFHPHQRQPMVQTHRC